MAFPAQEDAFLLVLRLPLIGADLNPKLDGWLPLKDDRDAVAVSSYGWRELGDLHLDAVDGIGKRGVQRAGP